ncbi:hypothetical protein EDD86DRAFT_201869 [Gorgonomyces haynaldii]|nr:hypothetical protein EDD86DRAFT_201869 [Gorgonomyces haynaldii]
MQTTEREGVSLLDRHYEDAVDDFMCIYTPEELEAEPWLRTYVSEQLARWGRWGLRGRAPALCFEAACVGALKFLEKAGHSPSERTTRADAVLARALAGIVIDAVEPMAREQGGAVREKAVNIVADEFLARAATPKISNQAKRRLRKRRSNYRVSKAPSNEEEADPVAPRPVEILRNNDYYSKRKGSAPLLRTPNEVNRLRKGSNESGNEIQRPRTPQRMREGDIVYDSRQDSMGYQFPRARAASGPSAPERQEPNETAALQAKLVYDHFGISGFVPQDVPKPRKTSNDLSDPVARKNTPPLLGGIFQFGRRRPSAERSNQQEPKSRAGSTDEGPRAFYAPPDWKMAESSLGQRPDASSGYSGYPNYQSNNVRPRKSSTEGQEIIRPRKSSTEQVRYPEVSKPLPRDTRPVIPPSSSRQESLNNAARRPLPRPNLRQQQIGAPLVNDRRQDRQLGQRKPSAEQKGLDLLQSVLDDCEDYLQRQ